MKEKIKEVYERINDELIHSMKTNTKYFISEFKDRLKKEFPNCAIMCDEGNNPVDVIVSCCLVARLSWIEDYTEKYCVLIFGRAEQAMHVLQKYYN